MTRGASPRRALPARRPAWRIVDCLKSEGGGMAQANGNVKAALDYLDGHFNDFQKTLVELSRVPSVSAAGFPPSEVRRSADAVAEAMRRVGIEHVEVLEIPDVHPYVYGDWLHKPGAPTILLYGHHDVQPPG